MGMKCTKILAALLVGLLAAIIWLGVKSNHNDEQNDYVVETPSNNSIKITAKTKLFFMCSTSFANYDLLNLSYHNAKAFATGTANRKFCVFARK